MALDSQGNGCYNSQKESGSGREGPTGGRREAGTAARPSAPEGAGPAVTAVARRLPRRPGPGRAPARFSARAVGGAHGGPSAVRGARRPREARQGGVWLRGGRLTPLPAGGRAEGARRPPSLPPQDGGGRAAPLPTVARAAIFEGGGGGGVGGVGRRRQVAIEREALPPLCLSSFLSRRLAVGLAKALPTPDLCGGPSQGPGVPGGCSQPTWLSGPSACVGPLSQLAHRLTESVGLEKTSEIADSNP